ncbi:hypothetical protein QBC43DRAFT_373115 [Cladorrhinum sp. PSN259]|nr:hypothetical protein QBC43DRAFT_373115 [Cladorrhinum sp. PSN259]
MMDHPSCLQVGGRPMANYAPAPSPTYNNFEYPQQNAPPINNGREPEPSYLPPQLPPPPPRPPRPPPPLAERPPIINRGPGGSGRLRIDLPIRPSSRGDEPTSSSSPYGYSPQLGSPGGRQLRPQNSCPDLSRYGPRSPGPSPLTPRSPRTPGPIGSAATFGPGITLGPNSPANGSEGKPFWQSALSEAKYFAGGLIPHPTESSKHFTILRHSPALIFYRGPSTSVVISIFSAADYPLPPDRTVWMQQRGFSGDSGMKMKAMMGSTEDWLEVTPAAQVQPHELDQASDRSWQRDIAKVASRSLKDKGPKKAHIPRETQVIRIPEASEDGYFRLHLCAGGVFPDEKTGKLTKRKVVCSSPIFRVASTSTDPSVIRGASLTTLPLEVGAFVGSKMILSKADPVLTPMEKVYDKISPTFVAQKAAGAILEGAHAKSAQQSALISQSQSRSLDPSSLLDPSSEPSLPFPLKLTGRVVRGTGHSTATLGIPTANLTQITPDDLRYTLKGTFLGWAAVILPPPPPPPPQLAAGPFSPRPHQPPPPSSTYQQQQPLQRVEYHPSIITISPFTPQAHVTPHPQISVHIIHSFPHPFTNLQLKIIIMSYLRPAAHPLSTPPEQQLVAFSQDVYLASAVLARPNWAPETAIHTLHQKKSERGLGERFLDVKEKVVGKAPDQGLQKLGVRVKGGGGRDELYGRGGYWIRR